MHVTVMGHVVAVRQRLPAFDGDHGVVCEGLPSYPQSTVLMPQYV